MGQIVSHQNEELGNLANLPSHLLKTKLEVDLSKEVNPNLLQLIGCN